LRCLPIIDFLFWLQGACVMCKAAPVAGHVLQVMARPRYDAGRIGDHLSTWHPHYLPHFPWFFVMISIGRQNVIVCCNVCHIVPLSWCKLSPSSCFLPPNSPWHLPMYLLSRLVASTWRCTQFSGKPQKLRARIGGNFGKTHRK